MNNVVSKCQVGAYTLLANTDDDGHLVLTITHEDGSAIIDCEADIAESFSEWGTRFTTQAIETQYNIDQRLSCPKCTTSLVAECSVQREYVNKSDDGEGGDDGPNAYAYGFGHFICGEYVDDKPANLSGGNFDLLDNSDRCSECQCQL